MSYSEHGTCIKNTRNRRYYAYSIHGKNFFVAFPRVGMWDNLHNGWVSLYHPDTYRMYGTRLSYRVFFYIMGQISPKHDSHSGLLSELYQIIKSMTRKEYNSIKLMSIIGN
jgi:hypothetical protein